MKQPSSSSNGHNGNGNGSGIDDVVIPKKPIQKVIPSRNTELMSSQKSTTATSSQEASNGAHCLGYVKPHSPMKNGHGVLTQSNNNKFNTSNGSNGAASIAGAAAATGGSGLIKSPVSASSKLSNAVKTHRTVTWNHDIPAEKLSFTMRREFDRQREETELMSQLRSVSVSIDLWVISIEKFTYCESFADYRNASEDDATRGYCRGTHRWSHTLSSGQLCAATFGGQHSCAIAGCGECGAWVERHVVQLVEERVINVF